MTLLQWISLRTLRPRAGLANSRFIIAHIFFPPNEMKRFPPRIPSQSSLHWNSFRFSA
jgi:hypothetical protein